uniref:Uncharacterized protein n=1 Tax=Oryza nivara TaxID=4536 RepID=A0A0E0IY91_ORYNI
MSYFYPKYRDGGRGEASNERAATGDDGAERGGGGDGAEDSPAPPALPHARSSQLVAPSSPRRCPPPAAIPSHSCRPGRHSAQSHAPVQLCGRSKGQEHGTCPSASDTLASSLLSPSCACAGRRRRLCPITPFCVNTIGLGPQKLGVFLRGLYGAAAMEDGGSRDSDHGVETSSPPKL